MRRDALPTVIGCLMVVLSASACVKSGTSTTYTTDVTTKTVAPPSATATGPVDARPAVASDAPDCPLLDAAQATDLGGMRLDHIQVLKRGTAIVGCRFFAIQGSALAASEHLPGPNQPVIEFTSAHYADDLSAHNALARAAEKGTDPNQYQIAAGVVGVAYRTAFDPADGARDWAVGFAKKTTLVVVRTATDKSSYIALQLARAVYPRF